MVLYANKNILISIENQEEAFDFYNKGQEHNQSLYTYFPESLSSSSVPGFEKENIRYQRECVLKTSSYNSVVCIGTPVSFKVLNKLINIYLLDSLLVINANLSRS